MPHQRSQSSMNAETKPETTTPASSPISAPRRPPPSRIPSFAPSVPSTPMLSPALSLRSTGSASPSKPTDGKVPTPAPTKPLPPKVPVPNTPVKKPAPASPVKPSPPATPKPAPPVFKEEPVTREVPVDHPLTTSPPPSPEKLSALPSPLKTTAPSTPVKSPRSPLSPAALAPAALSPPHTPGSSIELDVLGEKCLSLISEVFIDEPKFKDKATQTPTKRSQRSRVKEYSETDELMADIDARDSSLLTFFAEQGAHPPETRAPTPAVTPRTSTTFMDPAITGVDPTSAPVTPSGKNAPYGVISSMWREMRRSLSTSGAPMSAKGTPPRPSKEAAGDVESPRAIPEDQVAPDSDAHAEGGITDGPGPERTTTPFSPSDRFDELAELLEPHFEGKTNGEEKHRQATRALDELMSLAHPTMVRDVMDALHSRARGGA
ncbi:hypothetical protein Q8F55_008161 [Vanrija albida]|uniref:Ribosome assembly protein 3 n=1 Tax=Vanrija albida TaxID=181172 RepID=A0ABR3PWF1_9TREE